ncbi:TetR family transcriptional regulator [Bacillus sp. FJAT-27264]|uniref:TetR/AcrR family transcriptional regulator n=1 Tax=Paenibacillus sp. (strain DSM 101736 / FJAT-27264) TaxID=1850362 RepID=UPI000807FBCE|nr:TetR/AcrR family transcriptional regulator [Bacillus sp. FJAT-27264]OBZ16199.1 TetR family transcriptional regulator [Bacillus sp. FJAT-27264]
MTRSKEYDENAVLHKAMQLFWEQGYEKTSMSDLVAHMRVHRRSLYDTFKDKHTLFLKALDHYGEITDSTLQEGIEQSETATQALHFIFKYTIDNIDDVPTGCLFVNAAVELAMHDADADAKTIEGFEKQEQLLTSIIRWGQHNKEFTSDYDAKELGESLHNTLLGFRVMRRTSTSKDKLHRLAALSLRYLEY